MEIKEIKKRVKEIKLSKYDDEHAHNLEDQLYLEFIEYVSTFKTNLGIKAKEVLKTKKIDFARWYS